MQKQQPIAKNKFVDDSKLEREDLSSYFESIPPFADEMSQKTSKHFSDKILTGLNVLINMGALEVSKKKKDVEELMDHTKLSQEESKALQLKAKKEYIQQQLSFLKNQTNYSRVNTEDGVRDNRIVLSKDEHLKVMNKLKKEKIEREKKHQEFLNKLERQALQIEEAQRKAQQQQQQEALRKRRERISASLQKHRKDHESLLKAENESKARIKSIRNNKFVHQRIEQKYQQTIVLPNLQQKKKKLKEIREYRSFNIDQLKQHEKSYLENRQLHKSRQSEFKEEWHYKPPLKSQRLQAIFQEERLQKIHQLEEKKKQVDENLQKQQHFVNYLRENFVPKVDQKKAEEIRQRVQQSRTVRPETGNCREIGMTYLEHAKRLRKPKKMTIDDKVQKAETQRNMANTTTKTGTENKPRTTNYLSLDSNRDEQYYEQMRRRRLQKLRKEDSWSEAERIKQLKIQTDKINHRMEQKEKQSKYNHDSKLKDETLELLLSSIQAKIGIIEMYQ